MAVTQNKVVTAQAIQTRTVVTTTAKTNYADTSNIAELIDTATCPNGALIYRIWAIPRASCPHTQLQLYRSYNQGVAVQLADSALLAAYTMNAGTAITKGIFIDVTEDTPMRLSPGEELWVAIGTNVGGGVMFVAEFETL